MSASNENTPRLVIVGGGLAGAKAAEAARADGDTGHVTLIGQEEELPYERPPLSKGYLQDNESRDDFTVHDRQWYVDNNITLHLNTRATAIDTGRHTVHTSDGDRISYDKLILATGSTPRRLDVPGADLDGVHYLRTVDDSTSLRAAIEGAEQVAIIGGGWIGLEVAAAARQAGKPVTVIVRDDLPLANVLGAQVASVFAELHREHGVDLRVDSEAAEILGRNGTASGVRLTDGHEVDADLVVIGIGAVPNLDLAEDAGITIDNGVLVDDSLRSSDADIYAVGDIANAPYPALDVRLRVEHWATALNQPPVAVAAALGRDARWTELPYFFSDQYDLGMEYLGYATGAELDQVVIRGDIEKREFIAYWLDAENKVRAGMNVNVWDVVDDAKALINSERPVDPAKLADPDVPFDQTYAR